MPKTRPCQGASKTSSPFWRGTAADRRDRRGDGAASRSDVSSALGPATRRWAARCRRRLHAARPKIVHGLAIRARLPGGSGELKRGQRGRRRQAGVGVQHRLDVVVERQHQRLGVHRVEPQRLAVEEEQDHVGQGAGAEAAADGQVHDVAEPAALPLVVVELGGHRREAILGAPAAAAGGADEELAARPGHVDQPAVGPDDEIAPALGQRGQRGGQRQPPSAAACTSATPISASRVMWRASSSSAPVGARPAASAAPCSAARPSCPRRAPRARAGR